MKFVQMCAVSACALALFLPASAEAKIAVSAQSEIGHDLGKMDIGKPGSFILSRRGRGADDGPGDDRGRGRGTDDGPGDDRGRRGGGGGADDPAGDDRGGLRRFEGVGTGTV